MTTHAPVDSAIDSPSNANATAAPAAIHTHFVVDAGVPTRQGPTGVRFDFNYGARVKVDGPGWRVKLIDREAGHVLYDAAVEDALVTSTKRYYVNFRIEVRHQEQLVFEHDFDLRGQNVYFRLPVGTLGDILAWFPYVEAFRLQHRCKVYLSMNPAIWSLFKDAYPELQFVQPEDEAARRSEFYASYYLGIFFPATDRTHQPTDFRVSGLQKTIPHLLGLQPIERRAQIVVEDQARPIAEPYVCIASQASTQCKYWNHPTGWFDVVHYLKEQGYRVLCIDQKHAHGTGNNWNLIPYGAENFTGDLPLQQRANLLQHADFFVGLSSGLSWLAWTLEKPVVMVSGFTHPANEFFTPYRVIDYHACNSCWNDTNIEFDHHDFMWCPRHAGTERQFECTRLITPKQVITAIDRLMHDHHLDPRQIREANRGNVSASPYQERSLKCA